MKTKSKLKNKRGETLIEVLVSLLIIVLVMIMLPTAITLAAKLNKQAEEKDISTMMDRTAPIAEEVTVTVEYSGAVIESLDISTEADEFAGYDFNVYESEGYYFYDYK
ncbi:MAG: type II secretion system protein [Saccharofermentanales bacterium]|jgi:Tfp pilus assembly major pilin PilA|nr:prepilin-type N-terminal cleavage/methylation domain-containing protein [Bacillota bacterium]NLB08174.1 hypothetical protein [Clostridiales bacterium]